MCVNAINECKTPAECGRIQSLHERSSKGKFLQRRCSALGFGRCSQLQINETGADNGIKSHGKGTEMIANIDKKSSCEAGTLWKLL